MSEVAAQRVVFDVLLIKSYLVAAAGERAKQSAIRRGMPVAPRRGDGQPEEGDFQGMLDRQPARVCDESWICRVAADKSRWYMDVRWIDSAGTPTHT